MPTFEHVTMIPMSLDRVWVMFQDIEGMLTALTPPEQGMQLISAAPLPPRLGTEVKLSAKTPIGRKTWLARYVEVQPPLYSTKDLKSHGTAFFVDRQIEGPFAAWQHTHHFETIDHDQTRMTDTIDYAPPMGLLGRLAAPMVVTPQLKKLFAYRTTALLQRVAATKP